MSEVPLFFLVGAPRSGTTALANALSAHRDVLCHHELRVVDWGVAAMTLAWEGQAFVPSDPAERRRCMVAAAPLMRGLLRGRAEAAGKRVVGEKYPPDSLRVPDLRAALPEARFVLLVRDGRDVVASARTTRLQRRTWRRGPTRPSVSEATADWVAFTTAAADALADAGPAALTVRYEDIEADPSAAATQLEAFLGVGPCAAFRAALAGYRSRRTWRDTLSPEEQAEFRAHAPAEALLARFGYPPTPPPSAPPRTRDALLADAEAALAAGRSDAAVRLCRLLDTKDPDAPARAAAQHLLAHPAWPESVWAVMVVREWAEPAFRDPIQRWSEGRGLAAGVSVWGLDSTCGP